MLLSGNSGGGYASAFCSARLQGGSLLVISASSDLLESPGLFSCRDIWKTILLSINKNLVESTGILSYKI